MNPCPVDVKRRLHVLALDELDGTASLDIAFSVAPRFGLSRDDARDIAAEAGAAVSKWRDVAKTHKLKPAQIDRMSSAFEHEDLRRAASGTAKRTRDAKPPKKTPTKRTKAAATTG
jgi:serine/threonine-protein kinase HipA